MYREELRDRWCWILEKVLDWPGSGFGSGFGDGAELTVSEIGRREQLKSTSRQTLSSIT